MAKVIVSEKKTTDFQLTNNTNIRIAMIDADNYFFAQAYTTNIYLYNYPTNTYTLYAATSFGIGHLFYYNGYLYAVSSYGYGGAYTVIKDNEIILNDSVGYLAYAQQMFILGNRLYMIGSGTNGSAYYSINSTTHRIGSGASMSYMTTNYPCLRDGYYYASGYKYSSNNTITTGALWRANPNPYSNIGNYVSNANLGGGFSFILDNYFINTRTGYAYNFTNGTTVELGIEKARYENYDGCFDSNSNTAVLAEYNPNSYVTFIRWQSVEYNITYDIKNNSGVDTYITTTGNSPISKVRFNFSGSTVQYVFTTLTGNISGTYTPVIPDGFTLAGYSLSPNSTTVNFGLNTEIDDAINSDTTFYEVYKKYVPPATTFDIELYQNTADKLVLDKTSFLTLVNTLSGALRERCDIIKPTIIIEYANIPDFNYVHIPIWERYYYVDSVVSVRFGLWEISLTLDERFSYKDEILSQTDLLIARSESLNWYNPYLVDEMIPTESGSIKTVTEIPNTSLSSTESTYPFVVAVIGATP